MPTERIPDHSSLSRIRTRLDSAVYDEVFRLVLGIVDKKGLLKGKVAGVDSTYLRADASMKSIVRKDTGQLYQEYLKKLCEERGIANPTVDDCRRVDRKRKGKKTSNKDRQSKTNVDARIMRLKDGRTRLSYKAEHVVDMETGAVLAAEIYAADTGDTSTITPSLEKARANLDPVTTNETRAASRGSDGDHDPPPAAPRERADEVSSSHEGTERGPAPRVIEVVADKGYHKVELLRDLAREQYRTYISVPKTNGPHRWIDKGGLYTQQAYQDNRARVTRNKGKALLRGRGELLERSFAHVCDTGGLRRTRLRGRDNVHKRYLMQVAAMNLGLVLRAMLGHGTPRGAVEARKGLSWLIFVLAAVMAALGAITARLRASRGRDQQAAEGGWHVLLERVAG